MKSADVIYDTAPKQIHECIAQCLENFDLVTCALIFPALIVNTSDPPGFALVGAILPMHVGR